MGNCCGDSKDQVPAFAPTQPGGSNKPQVDLVEPSLVGLNPLEAFEVALPFSRILIATFVEKVLLAASKSGCDEGVVTMAALREEFDSPAWV